MLLPVTRLMISLKPPCSPSRADRISNFQPSDFVVGVGRDQRFLQVDQQGLAMFFEAGQLLLAHFPHVGIGVIRHLLGCGDVFQNVLVFLEGLHDRLDTRVLFRELAKLVLIGDDVGVREETRELLEAVANRLQLEANGLFHGNV